MQQGSPGKALFGLRVYWLPRLAFCTSKITLTIVSILHSKVQEGVFVDVFHPKEWDEDGSVGWSAGESWELGFGVKRRIRVSRPAW